MTYYERHRYRARQRRIREIKMLLKDILAMVLFGMTEMISCAGIFVLAFILIPLIGSAL